MWSPFFKRTFNSQFSVAKSAIFDFCDEESPFIVNMMLKHMYGATYDRQILALKCGRHVAVAVHIYAACNDRRLLENPNWCITWISRVCGPESPQLADSTLRQVFMDWVGEHYVEFYKGSKFFKDSIMAGTLLDAECLSILLVRLGEGRGTPVKRARMLPSGFRMI
ncbi:hypothetical protein D6D05_03392 [Aureobasidium pullulans]|nr:hypothetical protein D6D05_03392 [Aureobasidium pullulans]